MLNRLRQLPWLHGCASLLLATVLAFGAIWGLFWFYGQPRTMTSIKAESELVTFHVFNPELAIIYAQGLRISSWPDGSRDGQCGDGAVLPGIGAEVSYQRVEQAPLQVTVEGAGELRLSTGETVPFDGELLMFRDPSCAAGLLANRLPIWGPGKIGSPFSMRSDGPGPILLSATLDVFGRTIDVPLFGRSGAIYAAVEGMEIPPGSFIESDRPVEGARQEMGLDPAGAMFGFIDLSEKPGFSVFVSTESRQLGVTTPGARTGISRIDLSLFVQVVNDPGFLKIQLSLALLLFLVPKVIGAADLVFPGAKGKRGRRRAISGAKRGARS
ncbi:hypothetical protein [Rhizobium sp. S163]|uniref:hypothetical protein n=1 Tax=Rhizobium sp. S163 TaxID=3055039 RepID=UPI0025A994DF|nr:hypothetical protein [Rhizobium sp. S163]